MSKRVILCKNISRVFDNLDQAAEALGVSTATVSRKLSSMDGCFWRTRTYAIKTKDGCWHLAVRGAADRGWKTIDDRPQKFGARDVEFVRDITEGWG